MAANTRLASAVQILCVIAYKGPGGTTSEAVAHSLRTNPVVVRRSIKAMQRGGLVTVRPGKDGGVSLARPPGAITLGDIYRAVEGEAALFALRPQGNPHCPVDRSMTGLLSPVFAAAETAIAGVLAQTTLDQFMERIAA